MKSIFKEGRRIGFRRHTRVRHRWGEEAQQLRKRKRKRKRKHGRRLRGARPGEVFFIIILTAKARVIRRPARRGLN
jgi:hypothetical protein